MLNDGFQLSVDEVVSLLKQGQKLTVEQRLAGTPWEMRGRKNGKNTELAAMQEKNPYTPQLNALVEAMNRGEAIDGMRWKRLVEKEVAWDQDQREKEKTVAAGKKIAASAKLGGRVPARDGDENRPKCKKHQKFMKYNPAEDRMECTEQGCTVIARKRRTFHDTLGADVGSNPVVYRGSLEFITDEEGDLYLFLPEVNAAIEITGVRELKLFSEETNAKGIAMGFQAMAGTMANDAAEASQRLRETARRSREMDQATRRMKGRAKTVGSRNRLHNVPLPPHLNAIDDAGRIESARQELNKQGLMPSEFPMEDQVAYAINTMWPTIAKNGETVARFYTAQGLQIEEERFSVSTEVDKYDRCISTLRVLLEDELEEADLPVYVMLDGYALTEYGCMTLRDAFRRPSAPTGEFKRMKMVKPPYPPDMPSYHVNPATGSIDPWDR